MRAKDLLLTVTLLAGAPLATATPPPAEPGAQAADFAAARVEDTRTPPAGLSCAELYERRLALMRTQLDYRPPYSDDPRNKAAFLVGTMWTPGFYFLPFSAVQDYLDADRKTDAEHELDQLRHAAAMQQCYVR